MLMTKLCNYFYTPELFFGFINCSLFSINEMIKKSMKMIISLNLINFQFDQSCSGINLKELTLQLLRLIKTVRCRTQGKQ